MKFTVKLLFLTALFLASSMLQAGITYNQAERLLTVSDYPAAFPCTPALLHTVSRAHGWDVVQYDAAAETYDVYADLRIGLNDDTETFFNIAASNDAGPTVIVHGNVVVSPYFVPGGAIPNERQAVSRVNRLTIGMPGVTNAGGTLKINSNPENKRSLYVGVLPLTDGGVMRNGRGGELRVYGGTITALTQTWENAIGAPSSDRMVYFSGNVELHHATLSWMAGFMGYGRHITAINTTYEHGGAAAVNVQARFAKFNGCTFRNLKTAVLDWGGLNATLQDCVFEGNDVNWSLTYGRGLECIDCEFGAPRKQDVYHAYVNKATGKTNYPRMVSMRHIVVRVRNDAGRPVPNATVEARETQGRLPSASSRTGNDGMTPGQHTSARHGATPLLLDEFKRQASDTPNQPVETEYVWNIHVNAPGFAENITENYRPAKSWEALDVTLQH